MKAILHCYADDSAVPALTHKRPLALVPFLGATVVEHALAALAAQGVKRVRLEARDHASQIRQVVGRGEAWGLELSFATDAAAKGDFSDARVVSLETLPQSPELPLWRTYRDWYGAQIALLPAFAARRVGMKELTAGVFVGLRSQIAPDARLIGPCWIGANVFIGPRTVIGPGSIIEDGSYIDQGAEVPGSVVGSSTYVGAFTELRGSFAWGNRLLHLDSGSLTRVVDGFLLRDLKSRRPLLGGLRKAIQTLGSRLPAPGRLPVVGGLLRRKPSPGPAPGDLPVPGGSSE